MAIKKPGPALFLVDATALSPRERVGRDGAFSRRRGPGEVSLPQAAI